MLFAPMFLQSFCFAGYVFAILQSALPTIVKYRQLFDGPGDERRGVKLTRVHYDPLPSLYFLHDGICDFSGAAVLFAGQMCGHFGRPYCTPTLFANDHLPFRQMLKKIICALHRCWVFAVILLCCVPAILVFIVTQNDVAASAFCSPERGLAASNPCQFSADGFLLLLPSIARNSTNTAHILLEPILIISHFIGAI